MIVIAKNQTFGIFKEVSILEDRLLCDGTLELPFSVIGSYSISDDDSLMPVFTIPRPVPNEISPRQIRRALSESGLRTLVESAISAGDQELKDWWEWSTSFLRNHPLVEQMARTLGVTDQELDDLWRLGASL